MGLFSPSQHGPSQVMTNTGLCNSFHQLCILHQNMLVLVYPSQYGTVSPHSWWVCPWGHIGRVANISRFIGLPITTLGIGVSDWHLSRPARFPTLLTSVLPISIVALPRYFQAFSSQTFNSSVHTPLGLFSPLGVSSPSHLRAIQSITALPY